MTLAAHYRTVRAFTDALTQDLTAEDMTPQSMPDASPAKWHLAHTTWFFEEFVLGADPDYTPVHATYAYLFNSYYNAVGDRHARPHRGLVTRPGVTEIRAYRAEVDRRVLARIEALSPHLREVLTLGLHHEQQHQELLLTDLLHLLSHNCLDPAYSSAPLAPCRAATGGRTPHSGGLVEIGHAGEGFRYDNETPRHKVWLTPFALADELVTNTEYAGFIADRGYTRPELWMDLGFATARERGWTAPLYWQDDGTAFTLHGRVPRDPHAPVTHLSWFEADAYARWAGARLPTEFEWEAVAAEDVPEAGFVDDGRLHPATPANHLGQVWQWTASAYAPYPGYRPPNGALGEYNGKFMTQQYVLRGGSVATSASHIRPTYRNFFPPDARWQFSGLRLAWDA